ncbi:ATP-binding protein [Methanobrevibacter sp.]|uniref:ATP-binding protein n=1 Tax=Methanobrevibacter sp. TaxID=66852 RepID=UPI003890C7A3
MNSIKLKVELNELYALKEFIAETHEMSIPTELAVEELFVNIVNYSNADYIIVNVDYDGDLTIEFIDNGIEFDPTSHESSKKSGDINEVEVGGLGILLAKDYADEMTYTYENGENHLKVIKKGA